MALDGEDVRKIAHLARLEIGDDDAPRYAEELAGILDLVSRMNAADTDGVTPMAHPLDMVQRLRADEVTEPDVRERQLANAPAVEDGLFLVPRVID